MPEFDLRTLEGDRTVVYFGGPPGAIDAVTFGNALLAFVDTAYAISEVINPGETIEILLEAQSDGSFKARLRKVRKGLPGFLGRGAENLFWAFVGTAIFQAVIGDNPKTQIFTDKNEVVIQEGDTRWIIPREVHEGMSNVTKSPAVQSRLNQTFRVIQQDPQVTNFGLAPQIGSAEPSFSIPREKFSVAIERTAVPVEIHEKVRLREVEARLVILKAWLNHARRKWSFEWNGVPLSAPVKDNAFLDKLSNRDYLIGAGDALDVILMFKQNFVESLGVYENDQNSFVVKKVVKPVPRAVQTKL